MAEQFAIDFEKARKARDEAIERVEQAADEEWLTSAFAAVVATANTLGEFTTDDVWQRLTTSGVDSPKERRALGSVMKNAKNLVLIEPTGTYRASGRPNAHCCPKRVWRKVANNG